MLPGFMWQLHAGCAALSSRGEESCCVLCWWFVPAPGHLQAELCYLYNSVDGAL